MKKYRFKRETLESYIVISNEDETKNIACFKNADGKRKIVKINKKIKNAFDIAKKEDKSQKNKYDKHIEHSELTENNLFNRAVHRPQTLEETIIENDIVTMTISEIWKLPEPQNRRVYMKVIDEFSYSQIARIEKVHRSVIKRSVDSGIKKLQKKLKNFYFTSNK